MEKSRQIDAAPHQIGYARVSTEDQKLDLQMAALSAAGVRPDDVWSDKASGLRSDRPGLAGALKACRPGDVLVVWRLDRLARSTAELLSIGDRLQAAGVGLRSLTEHIDTSNAAGKLVYTVIAAMAEFERNLISERTKAGMAVAREKGRRGGRPAKLTDKQLALADVLMADPSTTGQQVADQFGVHRGTLYRALRDFQRKRTLKA
ncbi:DNA invertase Pin-like site-specific DNA recombinase [Azospirillum sp. OGB3]|uniref:recombinase family protein n=1 Tax=Azospirillum sp. OGB3 TaxID=2587012 RepID=UPI001605A761|nr:recombinase family protein [Azospirillum sp. OGB3]MBB3268839.1 DNA invertase Pin-like site-specific DNA recombinase [Azospirillum sp. OGB3]